MPRSLIVSAFLLGFTSLLLQIVVTRELLTSFLGNEISIAIVLLVWLGFVALGSGPLSRWLAPRECQATVGAAYVWAVVVASLWAVLWAQRCGGAVRFPGQVVGLGAMVGYSALALGPLCAYLGGLFTALCRAAEGEAGEDRSAAIYAWEALGAVAAGLLFHFVLAERVSAFGVAFVASGVYTAVAAVLLLSRRRWAPGLTLSVVTALSVAALVLPPLMPGFPRSFRRSQQHVLAEADSRYANLAVVMESGQMTFYESGLPAFTTEDVEANEIAVHPALLAHPNPRRILMIGGGLGGGLGEALKHPVERVDYVEIDSKLVELARRYLPRDLRRALDDPRVHLHLEDGRRYVKTSREQYDVVLVLVPDPATTTLGRYYTREFYQEVRRALAPGGLLCTGLSAAQVRLTGPRLGLHASVYHALGEVFPAVGVIPGERTQYLASMSPSAFSLDPEVLTRRLRERHLRTAFVNEAWLTFQLGPLPREMLLGSLDSARDAPANRDARPVSAYYWLRTWLAEMSPGRPDVLTPVTRAVPMVWLLVPLTLAGSMLLRKRATLPQLAAGGSILAAGFVGMGAQLSLVMAYQAVAGYLYHRIGLLMSLFMLGLAAGAAIGRQASRRWPGRGAAVLSGVMVVQAASALGLPLLFALGNASQAAVDVGFAAASAWLGCLVGLSFPLAVTLSAGETTDTARAASRLYALDLCGAAMGAVLIGAVAIPAVGIGQSAQVLAAVVLAALPPLGMRALTRRADA